VTGRELDITSERELAKWALIGLLTGGKSFDDKQLKEHIRSFDRRDPTKVDSVLRDVSTAIKYRHA
jgi:hypothetical protein